MYNVRCNQGLIMSDVPPIVGNDLKCAPVTNITYFLFVCRNAGERCQALFIYDLLKPPLLKIPEK